MTKAMDTSQQHMQMGTGDKQSNMETLDFEWVTLVAFARDMGVSKDDIRQFLRIHSEQTEAASTSEPQRVPISGNVRFATGLDATE